MSYTSKDIILQVFKSTKPFRKTLLTVFLIIGLITAIEALNTYFLSKVFDIAHKGSDLKIALLCKSHQRSVF